MQTASFLHITTSQVHVLSRQQYLEPHYPYGRRKGKMFEREDVQALAELREQYKHGWLKKLPQLAMRAFVASRRVEKKVDDILAYLGIPLERVGTTPDELSDLLARVEVMLHVEDFRRPGEAMAWANLLSGITTEHFELLAEMRRDNEPWRAFLNLADKLVRLLGPHSPDRVYLEHARNHLRNQAYFFERGARGADAADRLFPSERYSGRLLRALQPG